jgi:hypothetical protein
MVHNPKTVYDKQSGTKTVSGYASITIVVGFLTNFHVHVKCFNAKIYELNHP